jgi:homoserine dehydrogenase
MIQEVIGDACEEEYRERASGAGPSPREKHDTVWSGTRPPRTIRVGLLGLGNIGSAVVRAIGRGLPELDRCDLNLVPVAALIRDERKSRSLSARAIPETVNPDEFFRSRPDVVVEALGGIEPARTLIERALRSGIPVVTANKSVLAAHGPALARIARESGTDLLCEAAVVAGIPFLTLLRNRPLCRRATRVVGIFNGTSNFILSRLAKGHENLTEALAEAQRLGFAEPDATSDLSGRDAAEKLVITLQLLGFPPITVEQLEVHGIESLEPADLARARTFGGTIRPIAFAQYCKGRIEAFVGPAFVRNDSPLAGVCGEQNVVSLSREGAAALTLAGPGAGPDVTAATLIDDIAECFDGRRASQPASHKTDAGLAVQSPRTAWFLRCPIAEASTPFVRVEECLARSGIGVCDLAGAPGGAGRREVYILTGPATRNEIESAIRNLEWTITGRVIAIRAIENE